MDRMLRSCFVAFIILAATGFQSICQAAEPAIRMLILKHSREHMADGDADLAIQAVKRAANKGLKIKVIGNHFVDGRMIAFHYVMNVTTIQDLLEQNISTDATSGDTLIVFTIGHGFQSGGLDNIGQRKDVMKVLADAAGRHRQKILWWQLSCHACASLPSIGSLPADQQELFSIVASSSASDTSAAGVQGRIMEKVFVAMAEKSKQLDPEENGIITAAKLSSFLNGVSSGMGSRVFATSQNFRIFGKRTVPKLPIIDRNNQQGKYDEEYILLPE